MCKTSIASRICAPEIRQLLMLVSQTPDLRRTHCSCLSALDSFAFVIPVSPNLRHIHPRLVVSAHSMKRCLAKGNTIYILGAAYQDNSAEGAYRNSLGYFC